MSRSEKFPTHYRIGALNGKDVYYNPQEGLAVERDGRLVEMANGEREEFEARAAEDWYSEIGHGMAYGWLHLPVVI